MCSGKVYFDLFEEREKLRHRRCLSDARRAALSLPEEGTDARTGPASPHAEMVWCQEEPKNMGSWFFVEPYIEWVLEQIDAKHRRPRYAGRTAMASTATGLMSVHLAQMQAFTRRCAWKLILRGRHRPLSTNWPGNFKRRRPWQPKFACPIWVNPFHEATIAQWFKKPGDAVNQDEPLVELETDKVTVEVPAPAAGTLERHRS